MSVWVRGSTGLVFIEATGFVFEKSPGPGGRSTYYVMATNDSQRLLIGYCSGDEQAQKAADELWNMLSQEQKIEAKSLAERLGLRAE